MCVQSFPFGFWDFKFQFSLPLEHFYYQMYNKCIIVLFVLKNVLTTFGFK